ncbi:MAG: type II toxin-antitoxin system HicA family toxin [Pyrinomonadaceae bacterium]|nr:type II toxin-antitoxin system HicA family toxin [Pyrinomonadaceae bacterium]
MKRKELIRYLQSQGCEFLREGANHSWWHNPTQNKRSAVPRHTEVRDNLIKKICKDLGILPPK